MQIHRSVFFSPMKISVVLIFLVLTSVLVSDCGGSKAGKTLAPEAYYQKGKTYFIDERWDKAIEMFDLAVINNPGGELADDAQFHLAECHFNKKDYIIAISEYDQLMRRYGYSEYFDDAKFKIAECYFELSPRYYHDQEYTYDALQQYQEFIEDFPDSEYRQLADERFATLRERLARKLYEAGRLYKKKREWEAARIYFDSVLEKYYDLPIANAAKIEKAYCLIKDDYFGEAKVLISELKGVKLNPDDRELLNQVISTYNTEIKDTN